jgi:hypothetical protein
MDYSKTDKLEGFIMEVGDILQNCSGENFATAFGLLSKKLNQNDVDFNGFNNETMLVYHYLEQTFWNYYSIY